VKRRCDDRRGGFTLVEVLASLALAGIILPAAMAGVSVAMGLDDAARARTEAATLARGKLDEVIATEDWQTAETRGGFGEEWPRYSWELEIGEWDEPGLSEVTVTVRRAGGLREVAVSVSTLAYVAEEE